MNFNTFKEKIIDYLCDDPNFCLYNGFEMKWGELPDPGKNKRIASQGKIKMLVNTLKKIDKSSLSQDDQVDYQLCELLLEQSRLSYELEIDDVPMNMRMPQASDIISGPLFSLFINDPRPAKLRIVNIISRLSKVEEFLISYKRNLNRPVKRWVDIEVDKLAGLAGFFETILAWANEVEFGRVELLANEITKANRALALYKNFLEVTEKSKSIFIGEKQMDLVIKSKGITLTAKELQKIAVDFLNKNTIEVENLREKLIAKYKLCANVSAQELQDHLNSKFQVKRVGAGFQFILDRYENERDHILAFIRENKLFPVMEEQDMLLMETPSFMTPSIPAGAMMPPVAMREGTKKSLVYLTLSEELLNEHTEISIPSMMIHEGIPGHHLQLAWAASNKSILRRIFPANDLAEGWTTMLEDYMLDIGYAGELADEIAFSGKRDLARIGARVLIDLYFMSGEKSYLEAGFRLDYSSEDPFENAGFLLQKVTGFTAERLAGELNWYSQERGYPLSYLAGNYLVWDLKQKFTEKNSALSKIEADQKFHENFLKAGNMPVSILSELMLS